ncbi:hypothetical protein P700755_000264 [Psychroflexus torquis ATCC 700755]|uniref:Uncharacterized protein n=1 Tax=Psychroflexus torquis (strain ATCC 700755 / CIP 106069 / ACAM 623) TaxID=313595 RepID=K4I9J8_PSYTT|nr:DoxX family membrane protein [Psychroflexus torquis]AFU67307.1 hypothetical protein P700755_000264 [Psychroflexus torquis ATCC 700755]
MKEIIKKFSGEIIGKLDEGAIKVMKNSSSIAIRLSFGIIFIWFGLLKPLHLSPAEGLLKATVAWLPFGSPENWLIIIGWWEVVIGICFLFKKTTRLAIILLLTQMVGTFMPLVFLPLVTFQSNNILLPTLEGQYIIKNLIIISAALVLGGEINRQKKQEIKYK